MNLTIHLSDPGMHPKRVDAPEVATLDDALKLMSEAAGREYTTATIAVPEITFAFCTREVGESEWVVKLTKYGRERQAKEQYGIEVGQVYFDNDPREKGTRRVRVLGLDTKPGKATCATCDVHGKPIGHTLYISLRRLATKRLFTRIE